MDEKKKARTASQIQAEDKVGATEASKKSKAEKAEKPKEEIKPSVKVEPKLMVTPDVPLSYDEIIKVNKRYSEDSIKEMVKKTWDMTKGTEFSREAFKSQMAKDGINPSDQALSHIENITKKERDKLSADKILASKKKEEPAAKVEPPKVEPAKKLLKGAGPEDVMNHLNKHPETTVQELIDHGVHPLRAQKIKNLHVSAKAHVDAANPGTANHGTSGITTAASEHTSNTTPPPSLDPVTPKGTVASGASEGGSAGVKPPKIEPKIKTEPKPPDLKKTFTDRYLEKIHELKTNISELGELGKTVAKDIGHATERNVKPIAIGMLVAGAAKGLITAWGHHEKPMSDEDLRYDIDHNLDYYLQGQSGEQSVKARANIDPSFKKHLVNEIFETARPKIAKPGEEKPGFIKSLLGHIGDTTQKQATKTVEKSIKLVTTRIITFIASRIVHNMSMGLIPMEDAEKIVGHGKAGSGDGNKTASGRFNREIVKGVREQTKDLTPGQVDRLINKNQKLIDSQIMKEWKDSLDLISDPMEKARVQQSWNNNTDGFRDKMKADILQSIKERLK